MNLRASQGHSRRKRGIIVKFTFRMHSEKYWPWNLCMLYKIHPILSTGAEHYRNSPPMPLPCAPTATSWSAFIKNGGVASNAIWSSHTDQIGWSNTLRTTEPKLPDPPEPTSATPIEQKPFNSEQYSKSLILPTIEATNSPSFHYKEYWTFLSINFSN